MSVDDRDESLGSPQVPNQGGRVSGPAPTPPAVHGESSVTVGLNRECTSYDALVGVDDLTMKLGKVSFSVYGDGNRLWSSGVIKGGDPAVPVQVNLTGRATVRLVVEPHSTFDTVALADWAASTFTCS
jgi:hypothetical protein